jgi:hypothetical protein
MEGATPTVSDELLADVRSAVGSDRTPDVNPVTLFVPASEICIRTVRR